MTTDVSRTQHPLGLRPFWLACLAVWAVALMVIPDPRPLSAPEWAIHAVQTLAGSSEPKARFIAAISLRAVGLVLLGILVAMSFHAATTRRVAVPVLAATALLAVGVKWLHFDYFPTREELFFILVVSILGALLGLAIRRNWIAAGGLAGLCGALFAWGASTTVPEDLEQAARVTGRHLLESAATIGSGDGAFGQVLRMAFEYARENSHGTDPVFPNRAAILALGVIIGDDQVARIGRNELDPAGMVDREALRNKITVSGRSDLPRHFAVCAALTVLTDQHRALAVGIAKEISDSNPGGSGFSFVDMVANKAGIRMTVLASQDAESARHMQNRIAQSSGQDTFVPAIDGLPEGISAEAFGTEFGGLGGRRTRDLMAEIDHRVERLYPSN